MDEINDLRIHSHENSDQWGIRHQFESGRVHVDQVDGVASAIASVSRLREPPTLRVIQGGLRAEPKRSSQGFVTDRRFLVVVK